MVRKLNLQPLFLTTMLFAATSAHAQSCEFFLGYIADEAERPYAVKKVYQYTPERIQQILTLRDEGRMLCSSGQQKEGVKVLLEAVKLINFTRLR